MPILSKIATIIIFIIFWCHILIDSQIMAPKWQHVIVWVLWILLFMGVWK